MFSRFGLCSSGWSVLSLLLCFKILLVRSNLIFGGSGGWGLLLLLMCSSMLFCGGFEGGDRVCGRCAGGGCCGVVCSLGTTRISNFPAT